MPGLPCPGVDEMSGDPQGGPRCDDGRMDDAPSADRVAEGSPLEGHFVVGGSGLYVSTACLGRAFPSRTASYDLTIGLPQFEMDSTPPEVLRALGMPPLPDPSLTPPVWTYSPRNERERAEERAITPVWGTTFGVGAKKVYPESMRDTALVGRCRFFTTVTASNVAEFDAASEDFLRELDDWWSRFTSWVGVLTGQDFEGLGGYPWGATRSRPLLTWTSDASGQRDRMQDRWYFPPPRRGFPITTLQLQELEACVTATGNQDPPPAEWLFIRDARSLVNAGQNRRAVIDAGTAAELAMTTLIDNYLVSAHTDEPVKKALLKRYTGLEGRSALLRRLRPGLLSDQLGRDLIELRNVATHGGQALTDTQAQTAVDMAMNIVEGAYPLTSLLPAGAW